jgi:hypothetical protein
MTSLAGLFWGTYRSPVPEQQASVLRLSRRSTYAASMFSIPALPCFSQTYADISFSFVYFDVRQGLYVFDIPSAVKHAEVFFFFAHYYLQL